MSNQQSGGNKKRSRKARLAFKIDKANDRREKRVVKQDAYEHMQTACIMTNPKIVVKYQGKRRSTGMCGLLLHNHVSVDVRGYTPKMQKRETFEQLYQKSRQTRGRLGLNYNPDKRQEENPWQKFHYVGTFKLIDLVSKTIRKEKRHVSKATRRNQQYLYARFSR